MTQYLFQKGGKTFINWKAVAEPKTEERFVMSYLQEFGILSPRATGNFGLIGGGTILNPFTNATLYFTKKRYAEGYKKAKYSDARYAVHTVKYLK